MGAAGEGEDGQWAGGARADVAMGGAGGVRAGAGNQAGAVSHGMHVLLFRDCSIHTVACHTHCCVLGDTVAWLLHADSTACTWKHMHDRLCKMGALHSDVTSTVWDLGGALVQGGVAAGSALATQRTWSGRLASQCCGLTSCTTAYPVDDFMQNTSWLSAVAFCAGPCVIIGGSAGTVAALPCVGMG